jgi:hypothetical protein
MFELIAVLLGMGFVGVMLLAATAFFMALGIWVVMKIFSGMLGKHDKGDK